MHLLVAARVIFNLMLKSCFDFCLYNISAKRVTISKSTLLADNFELKILRVDVQKALHYCRL